MFTIDFHTYKDVIECISYAYAFMFRSGASRMTSCCHSAQTILFGSALSAISQKWCGGARNRAMPPSGASPLLICVIYCIYKYNVLNCWRRTNPIQFWRTHSLARCAPTPSLLFGVVFWPALSFSYVSCIIHPKWWRTFHLSFTTGDRRVFARVPSHYVIRLYILYRANVRVYSRQRQFPCMRAWTAFTCAQTDGSLCQRDK